MTCTIASDGSEQHWECKNEHEQPYTAIKILLLQKIHQLYIDGYTDFYVNFLPPMLPKTPLRFLSLEIPSAESFLKISL